MQIAAVQRGPVAARGDGMSEVAVTQPVSVALVCLRTSSLSRYTACMHTRLLCAHTLASCAHKCPTEQRHPQYQQPRVRGFSRYSRRYLSIPSAPCTLPALRFMRCPASPAPAATRFVTQLKDVNLLPHIVPGEHVPRMHLAQLRCLPFGTLLDLVIDTASSDFILVRTPQRSPPRRHHRLHRLPP